MEFLTLRARPGKDEAQRLVGIALSQMGIHEITDRLAVGAGGPGIHVLPRIVSLVSVIRQLVKEVGGVAVPARCQPPQFLDVFALRCQLDEFVGRVTIPRRREQFQLRNVSAFGGELDEFVGRIGVSRVRESLKLSHVAALDSHFDQLGNGIGIARSSSVAQVRRIRISHGANDSGDRMAQ
ncbi:hypothetical protein GCM10027089_03290 [Nocardia thraciensis]